VTGSSKLSRRRLLGVVGAGAAVAGAGAAAGALTAHALSDDQVTTKIRIE
jgi:hypothetical protein